jgi:superfamily II DNA or RNA helicase
MPVNNPARNRFSKLFKSKVRISGEKLFTRGLVSVHEHDAAEVDVLVAGRYRPSISYDESVRTHTLACSCTEVRPGWGCPHLWALVLWLDHQSPDVRRYPFSLSNDSWHKSDVDVGERDWEDEEGESARADDSEEGAAIPIPKEHDQLLPWQMILKRQVKRTVFTEARVSAIELIYTLSYGANRRQAFTVNIDQRQRRPDGTFSPSKPLARHYLNDQEGLSDVDQSLLMLLNEKHASGSYYYSSRGNSFDIFPDFFYSILPRLLASGRCRYVTEQKKKPLALRSDIENPPLQLKLKLSGCSELGDREIDILLQNEDRIRTMPEVQLFLGDQYVLFRDGIVSRYEHFGGLDWIRGFYENGKAVIHRDNEALFLKEYFACSAVPLELPPDISLTETQGNPVPLLRLLGPQGVMGLDSVPKKYQAAELFFKYDERQIPASLGLLAFYNHQEGRLVLRDNAREKAWRGDLEACGIAWRHHEANDLHEVYFIPVKDLLKDVAVLMDKGWLVDGETGRFRSPRSVSLQVSSGIDWFELRGQVDFDGQSAGLPEMLAALRKRDRFIRLGDGSVGILPEAWWKKVGVWAQMGDAEKDHLRFSRSQTLVLDVLLAEQEVGQTTIDETFRSLRQELRSSVRLTPCDPDASFQGTLRPYQREGLGWMLFLQRFRLGGCLADDMGLGKTVQVLALLSLRKLVMVGRPSLVVVPRSLIFNWQEEAARFAPQLKGIDASHGQRGDWADLDPDADFVLITYGTLVRDITSLKDIAFDYVILDEAQAIKNHQTARAKAVRLLKASHRLALSGTPIENRIEELWSIFEFLNPGFLGHSATFKKLFAADLEDENQRAALRNAIAPFILRRSKTQVALDLPPRTEDVLLCEMEARQQALYNKLRDHYRQSLLKKVQTEGMNRVQTQVLEALLRLRQAACHPKLIDPKLLTEDSVKLDTLIDQLDEIVGEGHKALIFSQFTSFLALVKPRIEERGWAYEYLDGKTRNRQERVERFQNDSHCPLFLISLKAGGLGLNLVAADYVFLLDPWWNPAVEAQAIDRTHRIGQERPVFAYRLICRDTVEEKILQLQKSKKSLADSIIAESSGMLKEMSADDLAFLLG